jgi:hypothetical protein
VLSASSLLHVFKIAVQQFGQVVTTSISLSAIVVFIRIEMDIAIKINMNIKNISKSTKTIIGAPGTKFLKTRILLTSLPTPKNTQHLHRSNRLRH